jgi:EPS-associated MarR family transcriptional regulator
MLRSSVEQEGDLGIDGIAADGDIEGARLALLRLLERHPNMSQRDLSRALGLSLGKTNYVLRALVDKGLVKIGNFRRSNNKLSYAYLLTPSGIREKLRLSKLFLARKEVEYRSLQQTIRLLRREIVKSDGR